MFLAITQGMAEWLLPKVNMINALCDELKRIKLELVSFKGKCFVEGPFRISVSADGEIIALWHQDYISGTGDESLGFVKLDGDMSLSCKQEIMRESFERAIYLVNQRLQGLLVEGAFYHRKHDNNIHTLLAGRGTEARQYSLGYYDFINDEMADKNRNLMIFGPSDSFRDLTSHVEKNISHLEGVAQVANKIIASVGGSFFEETADLIAFREIIKSHFVVNGGSNDFHNTEITTEIKSLSQEEIFKTISLTYEDWIKPSSTLNENQRRILSSEALDRYPLRVLGPGGSGKTLLMMLLAIKKAKSAKCENKKINIMYIVHSNAMKSKVEQRLQMLLNGEDLISYGLNVSTLSEYCRTKLQLDLSSILDPDASDAKLFQLSQVKEAIQCVVAQCGAFLKNSRLLSSVCSNDDLKLIFSALVLAEISISIKGHGLEQDKKRYVESERHLSRMHGVLTTEEREFVFSVYETYHRQVFEEYGVLDPDDLALSLYGSLRTPIWRLRRKQEGFDYIFVDEAQLFNENERRLFSLLSTDPCKHVPIALALDEAQSFYGQTNAGFATLGIKDLSNQSLDSIHRSTVDIAKLAFFVIQRSTNLFSSDFPDFTKISHFYEHAKGAKPSIEKEGRESPSFSKFILRRVRELRQDNVRQIAIVCHLESYWCNLELELCKTDLPLHVLRERGEKIRPDEPVVVLCRPEQIGGQEFDAVIVVGLEKGVLSLQNNTSLSSAIEQQMIRETYLSITRARYRVIFAISKLGSESELLNDAVNAGLINKSN